MSSRVCAMLAVLLAISSLPAAAAVAAGSSASFPGARLGFQLTLTEKDFLPAAKQFLPAIPALMAAKGIPGVEQAGQKPETTPGPMAQLSSEQFAKDLVDAFAGLKLVTVSGYDLKAIADADKIIEFYAQKMGLATGWQRTVIVNDPKGTFRLYVKPDLEEMFGLFVQAKRFIIVRTEGKIDAAKLAKLAAETIIPLATFREKGETKQPPPSTSPQESSPPGPGAQSQPSLPADQ